MTKLIMSVVSLYTSFAFLVVSRFLFMESHGTIQYGLPGYINWMQGTPFVIRCTFNIPLIISLIFLISYIRDKHKSKKNSIKEEYPE